MTVTPPRASPTRRALPRNVLATWTLSIHFIINNVVIRLCSTLTLSWNTYITSFTVIYPFESLLSYLGLTFYSNCNINFLRYLNNSSFNKNTPRTFYRKHLFSITLLFHTLSKHIHQTFIALENANQSPSRKTQSDNRQRMREHTFSHNMEQPLCSCN